MNELEYDVTELKFEVGYIDYVYNNFQLRQFENNKTKIIVYIPKEYGDLTHTFLLSLPNGTVISKSGIYNEDDSTVYFYITSDITEYVGDLYIQYKITDDSLSIIFDKCALKIKSSIEIQIET